MITSNNLKRLRFSLRTLMIVVLLVGVVLAPVVWKWHRYQKQMSVVEWIMSSGIDTMELSAS